MRPFLLLLSLLCALSANAQSIEDKLKARVLQIENDRALKNGRVLTDTRFASFQYRLIPIKDWWKMFYEIDNKFKADLDLVLKAAMADLQKQDSLNGTHQADSLLAVMNRNRPDTSTTASKEVDFRAKYENADPAQKVYEVLYELTYKQSGRVITDRKLKKAFYQHNLSEVHSLD